MFDNESGAKKILISSLLGFSITAGTSLILILLSALILNFMPDPSPLIAPVGKAVLYMTCLMGGYFAKLKSEKITASMVSGAAVTLLILFISMVTKKSGVTSVTASVIEYVLIFLSFPAGGLINSLISSKRPTRRRKRRR